MVVFRALSSERRAALRVGRTPMLSCDLTAEDFRPVWMPAEAVGGRVSLLTELEDISASGPSSQLSLLLSKALKQLGMGSRSFSTIDQWDSFFQRYVIAEVAIQHSTYAQILAHHAAVLCIVELAVTPIYGIYLAILYNELARKQWAARAARSDPTLDLLKEATNPAADLVVAAQTRLSIVLQGAGLSADASAAVSPVPTGDVSLASQLTSQEQATNALYRHTQKPPVPW